MRFANATSLLALFIALGGTSYAVATGSISSRQIKDNSIRSADVRNSALRAKDFAVGQLPEGRQGPQGPAGPAGPAGSPDSPQDVLTKLKQVDGTGSNLEADSVDGFDASLFQVKCQNGALQGRARVLGRTNLPSTYSSAADDIRDDFACGGTAQVRRIQTGRYHVCFPDTFATLAVGTPVGALTGADNLLSVTKLGPGEDDCAAGGQVDAVFDVVVVDTTADELQDSGFTLVAF